MGVLERTLDLIDSRALEKAAKETWRASLGGPTRDRGETGGWMPAAIQYLRSQAFFCEDGVWIRGTLAQTNSMKYLCLSEWMDTPGH